LGAIFRVEVSGLVAIVILGSLHLSLMSALGIWLWSNPLTFGNPRLEIPCDVQRSFYIILGKRIPLSSNALRIVSLVIYAVCLAPGFNILLPTAVFFSVVAVYRAYDRTRNTNKKLGSSARPNVHTPDPASKIGLPQYHSKGLVGRSIMAVQGLYNPFLFPVVGGLVLLFAFNVAILIDIELTLWENRGVRGSVQEGEWTFGQSLAVLLLVLPLRDLRIFGARRNFTSSLQNAVRWHASTDVLRDLVRRGANVNVKAEGGFVVFQAYVWILRASK
jgi:hypothetical protein